MRIGAIRHRLEVKRPYEEADGIGGTNESEMQSKGTLWGAVKELKGYRALQYSELVNGTSFEITIRGRPNLPLDEKCIFTYDGRDLSIHSIEKSPKGDYLHIIAYTKEKLVITYEGIDYWEIGVDFEVQ